ncbi:MAG: cytochrome C [Acidobacteria bacterium 21-70-11]|nr:MAG: cytochrome C [Acidobacteria bacterium 21-70-11]OYW05413.1 MAG: cytochrome C [Acidobacteria bacterium 37-71-11]HQT94031.1 cytochrome c3 family protein [Thermoanaerobaculaceae bacterium]HQU34581.1 cytochrome c3 family protein [Thermoanaerobaculaceae bacterium]
MTRGEGWGGFVFPKWTNLLRPVLAATLVLVPAYLVVLLAYGASPRTTNVGYRPVQPVPYSHALHAGQLGIDCRYCHNTVEVAADAALPPTQTCMNCHARIRTTSPKLLPVRESYATGLPIPWVRVHDLPDYVYFNHSAHVRRGVGCVECHGRVDTMDVVTQVHRLSMGWCLDCHRHPEPHLRPPDMVTKMDWVPPEDPETYGRQLRQANNINPPTDCWTCHR